MDCCQDANTEGSRCQVFWQNMLQSQGEAQKDPEAFFIHLRYQDPLKNWTL